MAELTTSLLNMVDESLEQSFIPVEDQSGGVPYQGVLSLCGGSDQGAPLPLHEG